MQLIFKTSKLYYSLFFRTWRPLCCFLTNWIFHGVTSIVKWHTVGYSVKNHEICYHFIHILVDIAFLCTLAYLASLYTFWIMTWYKIIKRLWHLFLVRWLCLDTLQHIYDNWYQICKRLALTWMTRVGY